MPVDKTAGFSTVEVERLKRQPFDRLIRRQAHRGPTASFSPANDVIGNAPATLRRAAAVMMMGWWHRSLTGGRA